MLYRLYVFYTLSSAFYTSDTSLSIELYRVTYTLFSSLVTISTSVYTVTYTTFNTTNNEDD